MKILIVEHPEKTQSALDTLKGHNVSIVSSYFEAVNPLYKKGFEVLLTNLHIKPGFGWEISYEGGLPDPARDLLGWRLALIGIKMKVKFIAVIREDPWNFPEYCLQCNPPDFYEYVFNIDDTKILFTSKVQKIDIKRKPIHCYDCEGTGVDAQGNTCRYCQNGVIPFQGKNWGDILKRLLSKKLVM